MLIALVQRYIDDLFIDLEATALTLRGTGQRAVPRALLMEATNWKTSRASDADVHSPALQAREHGATAPPVRLLDRPDARRLRPLVRLGDADGSLDLPPDADPEITTDPGDVAVVERVNDLLRSSPGRRHA